jgi:hypothetical protein
MGRPAQRTDMMQATRLNALQDAASAPAGFMKILRRMAGNAGEMRGPRTIGRAWLLRGTGLSMP